MKVLVTGARGYVGSYLLAHEKRVSFRPVLRKNIDQSILKDDKFYIQHFNSQTNWSGAFQSVDAVVHLAALNNNQKSNDFDEVNHLGTLRLAREASKAGVKRFIFVSSSHVNGASTDGQPFNESMKTRPHGYYALSKAKAEEGLLELGKESGMEVVILRPALVFGPNAKNNFSKLVKLVKLLPILPFGCAHKVRSFISLTNLTDLIYVALIHPKASGQIFLAADSVLSIKDFTSEIAKGLNKKLYQLPLPLDFFNFLGAITGKSEMINQIFGEFWIDTNKLKTILEWEPKVSLQETMATLQNNARDL